MWSWKMCRGDTTLVRPNPKWLELDLDRLYGSRILQNAKWIFGLSLKSCWLVYVCKFFGSGLGCECRLAGRFLVVTEGLDSSWPENLYLDPIGLNQSSNTIDGESALIWLTRTCSDQLIVCWKVLILRPLFEAASSWVQKLQTKALDGSVIRVDGGSFWEGLM